MRNLMFLLCMFYFCQVHAQDGRYTVAIQDTSSGIKLKSDYHDVWKNHFQYTLFEKKPFIQSPTNSLLGYTPNHLPGLFCKMEYKIESKSKLAPRFRLGSLNYTNWMEGKTPLYMRYMN